MVAGIDEAGRGPVLGPMVVAGVLVREGEEALLLDMGVRDSKKLTPATRASLYPKIVSRALRVEILKLEPREIDSAVRKEKRRGGLNYLEAISIARIINRLKPHKAYVDTPHLNPVKFKALIAANLTIKGVEVVCEHHADEKYPVVSAASIIAKVERDRVIAKLREIYGELGSGYPSDLATKKFLTQWYGRFKRFPSFVRATWKTTRKVEEGHKQVKLA